MRLLVIAVVVLSALGVLVESAIRGSGAPQRIPGTTLADIAAQAGGRFQDPLTVASLAPDAHIVLDETCQPFTVLRYRTLAQARGVSRATLPTLPTIADTPTAGEASWVDHAWRLWLDPEGPADRTLLVWCDEDLGRESIGTGFDIVDVSVARAAGVDVPLDSGWEPVQRSTGVRDRSRSATTDGLVDLAVLLILAGLGAPFVPRSLGRSRAPVALLVGMSVWSVAAMTLLPVGGVLIVSTLLSGRRMLRNRRSAPSAGTERTDVRPALAFFGAIAVVTQLVRATGWHLVHPTDTMLFLLGGWAFGAGEMEPALLFAKRGLAQQALHGPAFLLGVEGLQSLTPVAFVTGLWLAVDMAVRLTRTRFSVRSGTVIVGTLVVVVLSPHVVRISGIYNSHLLVGSLLLGIAGLWAVNDRSAEDLTAVAPAAGAMGATLVLLRPEGVLLLVLLLVGTLRRDAVPAWRLTWRVIGLVSMGWSGLLMLGVAARGQDVGLDVLIPLVLGAAVALAPTVLTASPALRRYARDATLGLLWLIVISVVLLRPGRVSFFSAARVNVLESRGGWGLVGVLLAITVVAALAVRGDADIDRALDPVRTLLIGFLPVSMIAKMADNVSTLDLDLMLSGGGVPGFFDSVNRMWMHVLVTALLLILVRHLSDWGVASSGDEQSGRMHDRIVRLGAATIIVLLAAAWNPRWVEAPVPMDAIAVADTGSMTVSPAETFERAMRGFARRFLPLAIPTAIAVLFVGILMAGSITGPSDRVRVMRTVGSALAIAALMVLSVGRLPTVTDRDLVRLEPPRPGAPQAAEVMPSAGTVDHVLADGQRIHPDDLRRDGLWRWERSCVEVPVVVGIAGSDVIVGGSVGLALVLEGVRSGPVRSSDVVRTAGPFPIVAIADDRLVGCVTVSPRELRAADRLRVVLTVDGLPEGMTVGFGTLDIRILREQPSYRERVHVTLANGAFAAGVGLMLASLAPLARRRPRWKVVGTQ